MFYLNKNVYLVEGAVRGAIYQLETGKVFSIDHSALALLEALCNSKDKSLFLSDEFCNQLISMGLLSAKMECGIYTVPNLQENLSIDTVWLELTDACNFNCVHCYEGNNHLPAEKQLTISEWESVICQLAELKVKNAIVIGGEPCLYKDIVSVLKILSEKGISTTLFTNGTIMGEEIKQTVIADAINVKVSIYGDTAEVHDSITGVKGSFDKMLHNVTELIEKGASVSAAVIAMKENQDTILGIRDFLYSRGIKYSRYDVIRPVFGGTQDCHMPTKSALIDYAYRKKPNFSTSVEKFFANMKGNSCWRGKIAIKDDGDVLPCEFERNIVYGNVRNLPIAEIVESDQARMCWGLTMDKVDDCKICEYRYACRDCRPVALSRENQLYSKSPRCLYNPKIGEWKNDKGFTNID